MLFFVKVRITPKELSLEQLWDIWEKETEAAQAGLSAGKILSLYKVAGQRFVLGVVDVESHEELDRIIMGALPMTHYLEFEEILPVREYAGFAEDVRRRWQG